MSQYARGFVAGAVIGRNRIVSLGADNTVREAADATTIPLGISQELDAEAGELIDVSLSQVESVTLGGTVDIGKPVMAMAGGLAVEATAGNFAIGIALESGIVNERIRVLIARTKI